MSWRLLDTDSLTGRETWWTWDSEKKQNVLEYRYPEKLNEVHRTLSTGLRNDTDYSKKGIKQGWWHIAHIPDEVQLRWHAMGVDINDPKELRRMAQHPDWAAACRVTDGKF
jgi:hypothetical protein